MGIFGWRAPKFVFDKGGLNESTVILDYAVLTPDFQDTREIEHESVINAHREWTSKGEGDHITFDVLIHLHKYPDAKAKFEEIYQFKNKDVVLYPHKDGVQFRDESGNDVLFYITYVRPQYLTQTDFVDVLFVQFKSKDLVDLSQNMRIYLIDDSGDILLDDSDTQITT